MDAQGRCDWHGIKLAHALCIFGGVSRNHPGHHFWLLCRCRYLLYMGLLPGGAQQQGTLRRRLSFITISSGLFTLAVAGNVVTALLPTPALNIGAIGQAITAISAVLYYVAFVPPRWLRRAWQFEELRDYFSQTKLATDRKFTAAESFQQLCTSANQAVHGMTSAVVQWDDAAEQWQILASTDLDRMSSLLQNGRRLLEQKWLQRQPCYIDGPDVKDREERRQIEAVGARTWLFVPIQAPERIWGVLLVLLRDRSLFIDDDLGMLELFTQQCAVMLDNYRLIDELQGYSEQLELRVNERTEQLLFLANASRILAESFDYSDMLKQMAQLTVPQIADLVQR